jgi:hypothetical protein
MAKASDSRLLPFSANPGQRTLQLAHIKHIRHAEVSSAVLAMDGNDLHKLPLSMRARPILKGCWRAGRRASSSIRLPWRDWSRSLPRRLRYGARRIGVEAP